MDSHNRNRKKPERYGENGHDSLDQSIDSEPYGDDSVEDETYTLSSDHPNRRDVSTSSSENSSAVITNFDDEFEKIQQNSRINLIPNIEPELEPTEPNQSSIQLEILNQLKMPSSRTLEMTKRIGVIEASLMRGGKLISIKEHADENSQYAIFSEYAKQKKKPFKTPGDFKEFEMRLTIDEMVEAVRTYYIFSFFCWVDFIDTLITFLQVNALSNIRGLKTPAMLGNKTKMIRKVLFAIIENSCFSFFSWTGKAANGGTKNALQKCPQIMG